MNKNKKAAKSKKLNSKANTGEKREDNSPALIEAKPAEKKNSFFSRKKEPRQEKKKVYPVSTGTREAPKNKVFQFVSESYAELKKVTWPDRTDVISSVKIVIVSTLIIALVLGLVDILLLLGVQTIF